MNDNNTEKNLPEESSPIARQHAQSIGQTLKKSRVEQKIEIEQVCNQLNLSSHVVEALESDNYESLPEIAYIRGYIVSYCRLLGLDSFHVLKQLVVDDPNLSISNSITSGMGVASRGHQTKSPSRLILPVLLAIIIGAGVWYYLQNNSLNSGEENSAIAETNTAQQNEAEQQTSGSNNAQVSETPAEQVVADDKRQLLELEFNAVSWVDIENNNKERIVYKSFPRGEKYQVKAELPLNIFIDNAKGVFLRYEGQLIDLTPYITDGYAKFTLNE